MKRSSPTLTANVRRIDERASEMAEVNQKRLLLPFERHSASTPHEEIISHFLQRNRLKYVSSL